MPVEALTSCDVVKWAKESSSAAHFGYKEHQEYRAIVGAALMSMVNPDTYLLRCLTEEALSASSRAFLHFIPVNPSGYRPVPWPCRGMAELTRKMRRIHAGGSQDSLGYPQPRPGTATAQANIL